MGTPEFAVAILDVLVKNTNVVLVVTQPDKIGNRGKISCCEVKKYAVDKKIEVFQPVRIKEEYQEILKYKPDIIVTCAYGQILPKELIFAPFYKTINVHGSILPKYRGGAPIQRAIINGDDVTGITIMKTDTGMDNGDILYQEKIDILDSDTYDSLASKMSILGAKCLIKVLPSIFDSSIESRKQDSSFVTFANIIKKEDEIIDFNLTAKEVVNKIRGLSSNPGAYAMLDNERVKIYFARIGDVTSNRCGEIIRVGKEGIVVAACDREVIITDIGMPNKKRMSVLDMLNGYKKDLVGKVFNL